MTIWNCRTHVRMTSSVERTDLDFKISVALIIIFCGFLLGRCVGRVGGGGGCFQKTRKNNILRYFLLCSNPLTMYFIRPFLARLYESTGRAIAVTTASASVSTLALLKMLKFLVKVFKSLYLLNPRMDLVGTLPDVLCCTIMIHIGDLEVKVTDFEILS